MNSINDVIDRLQDRIGELIQRVDTLRAENKVLVEKINELEQNPSPQVVDESLQTGAVREALLQYITRLDDCIASIKRQ